MNRPLRLVALISGSGSNLEVLLDAMQARTLDVEVVHVISNRADAGGLVFAEAAGVPTTVIDKAYAGPSNQDLAIERLLRELEPDLVLLTGYMRILGSSVVNAFRGQMINQHPSLLPQHKGLHTHRRALEAGDNEHGASVHFVTPELDGGPVIAQVRVPVKPGDDEASLAARVAPREKTLLLAVLDLFTRHRVEVNAGGVLLDGRLLREPLRLENDTLK